ncbi:hypothetical protein C490_14255 [Natronobacterium gregoryi SP2]|uniref:Uncharacterized protein n=1 Tax=Natronobacterium gregoryi (strain ATCC 43098 / DSM 3393 / CCM 3738 / CIP 104747 / IAM 13177 / JCM 8860 / NBRC 102187 / NCIMB 2189 / SP2) TaxID=797304 RepID=L9XSV2_NATGS|nr:hypothetical protein C490_14255 [Natronobacterium gregoryi SP2]
MTPSSRESAWPVGLCVTVAWFRSRSDHHNTVGSCDDRSSESWNVWTWTPRRLIRFAVGHVRRDREPACGRSRYIGTAVRLTTRL